MLEHLLEASAAAASTTNGIGGGGGSQSSHGGVLHRQKVTVHRDPKRLLREAEAMLAELRGSRVVLEIAFDAEVGFGLGPTLEFYTLVSHQLMASSLGLWHGHDCTPDGLFLVAPTPGLYPRPIAKNARASHIREVGYHFCFIVVDVISPQAPEDDPEKRLRMLWKAC